MTDVSRYAALFQAESREHVDRLNDALLRLEAGSRDAATVGEVFRSLHTLKGMSGAMGYRRAAEVAHALEQLLEPVRAGALELDAEMLDALFAGVDALEGAIAEPEGPAAPAADTTPAAAVAAETALRAIVVIAPTASLPAVRAVLVLRRARDAGEVDGVQPAEDRLAAGDFGGTLRFRLRTRLDAEEVRATLLAAGEIAHLEVEVEGAEGGAREAGAAAEAGVVVRVPQARLDAMLDQIGEMVIARDRLGRLSESLELPELSEVADQLAAQVGVLRDEVMAARLAPVREVLDRFPRLLRDAARSTGRRVALAVSGDDTPLDRALLNELGDLLVHLLRNAVDHGIEPPDERRAAGKPETGEIRISATQLWSRVEVEVRDDGRGVPRELVRERAVERGWIADGTPEPTDAELLELITRPGFSTAERVTDLSGRGVGLDVVRSRVQALGGSLRLQTEAGQGTGFTLSLPLTLAIVRALLVEVGGESYAFPVRAVAEVAESGAGAEWLELRDERIALFPLAALDGDGDRAYAAGGGWQPVVVVEGAAGRIGVRVDRLAGQAEAVVKPLDAPRGVPPVFAGAALLPDGRISLILDVPRLCAWIAAPAAATLSETRC